VLLREAFKDAFAMLIGAAAHIVGHTDIQRAEWLAREDVDPVAHRAQK
jgi:hypothetical protein